MSLTTSLRSNRVLVLVFLLCVLAALFIFQGPAKTSHRWRPENPAVTPPALQEDDLKHAAPAIPIIPDVPTPPSKHAHTAKCDMFPDPGNVAIAIKTGATEAIEKIPILMLTAFECAKNVMIFSDLEQDVAGYHLHDSLKDIPKSAMEGNSDFEFYWHLQEAKKYGEIEAMLKGARDPRLPGDLAAWTLDKYKQLHILESLYEAYPNKDWYMMVDADTYLIWPNLLTWLQKLPDPKTNKQYLGSPAQVGDVKFAHGGSGILLSHAAMYDFAVTHPGAAASWDKPMHDECCGDLIIGTVLKSNGILLQPSWPTINGEKPITLPFGPTHWCEPVVTMHHVLPNEVNLIAEFEESRNDTQTPLTFSELYHHFTKDVIPESFDNWENHCLDKTLDIDSFAACRTACEDDSKCFQFNQRGNECHLGHSIHLGEPKLSEGELTWRSGWLQDRIKAWVDKQAPCHPEWPHI